MGAVGACGCNMLAMALSLLLGLTHASSATPPPPAIPPIGGEPLLSHPLLTYTGCRRVSAMPSPLRQHTWMPMSLLATHTRDLAASRTTPILSLLFCSGSPQSSLAPILPSLWSLEPCPDPPESVVTGRGRLQSLNHDSAKDEGAWPKLRILFMWGGLWGAPAALSNLSVLHIAPPTRLPQNH